MHRDVKLENLQFGGDGGLRIVDFGLVRDLREEEHQNLTQTGVFLGTPWGIAPEQAKDPRAVDDRADVYSLGCVLYQLLSGKAPFSTTHRLELVAAHLRDTPPEVPGLAEPLRALLTRMLDKAREKRPSADDVANALEKYLQAPPAAAPPSRWARGLWALVALFFVCAAVLMFRVREGTIVIEGIPEHAEVFVDGDRATVRLRPDGKSFEIRAVPGKRRVEVRTGDVVVYGKELDVALGRGDPIRVRIEPPAAPVPPVVPPVAPPMPDVPLPTPPEPLDDGGFVQLFNGKNLDGWKAFLKGEKADPATTFFVANGQIQATGALGYLFTTNSYKNYVLRYRWAFPKDLSEKTSMNSGLLMHIQEPHKVWPHSVEVQGRHQDHGKLFFIGLALNGKASQKFDENAQKKALKAPHEWQTTEVTSQDGKIEVRLNGTLVATGESPLTSGPIGFQSEGARIFFKDIQIKIADDGSGAGAPGPTPYKIDDFVAGAVWKGWRDYEEGAYAPKKVPYELHIRKRTGDTFVGHTFNNGPNRNHAEVTGQIKDGVIRWDESPTYMPGKVTITGKHVGGGIQFKFDGQYGMNAATRGSGALTREVANHADRIQAGAVFLGWRTDKIGADADKTVAYMLWVRERVDDWFTARVVDGARNLAELKGVIAGDAISWREAVPLPGWSVDIQGKWQSDQFRFAFVAKTRDGVKTREGDGALTYFPPFDPESPATTPADEAAASFVAGSIWKGWRWYERASVLQGTVSYELYVQRRVGNKFSGYVFDNGTGRNRADVMGEVRGKTIVWEERPQHMKAVVTSCGIIDGDRIQLIFDGVYPDRPREGSGEVRRVAPTK